MTTQGWELGAFSSQITATRRQAASSKAEMAMDVLMQRQLARRRAFELQQQQRSGTGGRLTGSRS